MNRQTIYATVALTFLVTAFIVGSPFDFRTVDGDSYAAYSQAAFIFVVFILTFVFITRIDNRTVKKILFVPTIIFSVLYGLAGIWNWLIISPDFHPMWEDRYIYSNKNGTTIIKQFRETSGSIHDYRDQRVVADYGDFRIFLPTNTKSLKETWTVYDIRNNCLNTVNYDRQACAPKGRKATRRTEQQKCSQ